MNHHVGLQFCNDGYTSTSFISPPVVMAAQLVQLRMEDRLGRAMAEHGRQLVGGRRGRADSGLVAACIASACDWFP
jgi:hypothetical protein